MFGNRMKKFFAPLIAVVSVMLCSVQVFAGQACLPGQIIPCTGDGDNALLFPIMGGLLLLSLVLIVVYVVLSAKKKKK